MELFKTLSRIYPRKLKESYKKIFTFASAKTKAEDLIGIIFVSSIILSVLSCLFSYSSIENYVFLLFPAVIIIIHVLTFSLMTLRADARGKAIEEVLPDALQLMSSNLKAGLTTDKALMLAVKPEFGPLADELNIVGKEVIMGKDIGKAMIDMSARVKSEKLKEVALLIEAGLKSGGQLVALLNQTAQNLRNQKFVEEKIRSSVFMYFIFIFSAISFGAPLLFGLSSFLVDVLSISLGSMDIPQTAMQLPISLSQISVTPSFIMTYVIICLITTSILGSLVLGLIRKGKEREGLKYAPILIALALAVFFLVRTIISNTFGATFF